MAIYLATGGDYLQRTTDLPAATGDRTIMYWVRFRSASSYRIGYALLDDPGIYTNYWEIWHDADAHFDVAGTGYFALGQPPLNVWTHFAFVQAGTSHTAYVNGVSIGSYTFDLSALTPGYEMLGNDTFSDGDLDLVGFRSWSAALTQAQISAERGAIRAKRLTNLFMDTPLQFDTLDYSGNGRHWTEVGTPTITVGNAECASPIVISSLPYTDDALEVFAAGTDLADTDPCLGAAFTEHTLWYQYTPADASPLVVTAAIPWDAMIAVFIGSCGSFTPVACYDNDHASLSFTPTPGTPYTILIATFEEARASDVLPATFALRGPSVPSTPVLTASSTTSRNVVLSWSAITGATSIGIERCSGDGCTGFVQIAEINGAQIGYTDRGLTPATLYRYRVRGLNATEGNGAYSNIAQATTVAGSVGVVQYGGAIGFASAMNRNANAHCGLIAVYGGVAGQNHGVMLRVSYQEAGTYPHDGCGDTIPIFVEYAAPAGQIGPTVTGYIRAEYAVTVEGVGAGIANCVDTQLLEIRWREGSADLLTGTHAADGYIELRYNGGVIQRIEDIALGIQGFPGWSGFYISPSGQGDSLGNLGGMTFLYINAVDTYGAAPAGPTRVYYQDFSSATEADLWATLGGYWTRRSCQFRPGGLGPESISQPALVAGEISANNAVMQRLEVVIPPITTPSTPEEPGGGGGGGGGGGEPGGEEEEPPAVGCPVIVPVDPGGGGCGGPMAVLP